MANTFSTKTFKYFELAQKNRHNKVWFEKNKDIYLQYVREPFENIIVEINKQLTDDLPRIKINPQGVCRPVRPANRAKEEGFVKNFSHITLWEKKTSLFEWNPGIHIQFGVNPDDNFIGLGLYMISSRQMSLLRNGLVENFDEIDQILSDKKTKKVWGEILGERFKRFPKGFNPEDPATKYLWHKQFYLGQQLSRTEVKDKNLAKKITKDLKLAMPFFSWVRKCVGTY